MANDYGENSYKIFNRGINVFNRGINDFKWEIYTAIALACFDFIPQSQLNYILRSPVIPDCIRRG